MLFYCLLVSVQILTLKAVKYKLFSSKNDLYVKISKFQEYVLIYLRKIRIQAGGKISLVQN
jgi:hypothetical protein